MSTPRIRILSPTERASTPGVADEITDETQAPSFSEMKAPTFHDAMAATLEPTRKPTIEELVACFDRPMRPPAPQPTQRAASDGGMFVAHYAVVDPARSMDTPAPVPSVVFEEPTIPTAAAVAEAALTDDQRAFKAQILATPRHLDDVHFDAPALGTTMVPFRRRHRSTVAWALAGAVIAVLLAVPFLVGSKVPMRSHEPASNASTTLASTPSSTSDLPPPIDVPRPAPTVSARALESIAPVASVAPPPSFTPPVEPARATKASIREPRRVSVSSPSRPETTADTAPAVSSVPVADPAHLQNFPPGPM